jgi:hypothetical protein
MRIYLPRKYPITKFNKPILPLNWGLIIRQYCRQGKISRWFLNMQLPVKWLNFRQ